jgi:succinoglycan biosynthesis protein ExoM
MVADAVPTPVAPRLAVCICTYRRPAVLERLLVQIGVCAADAASVAEVVVVVVDDDPDGSAHDVATAAELLATIDDDCWPVDGWLRSLVEVQSRTGADVVAGQCDTRVPAGSPRWLTAAPFVDAPSADADGAPTDIAYLKNLLLTRDVLERLDLRFDERFGVAGGEDAMFFSAGRAAGWHCVAASRATVWEELTEDRATYRWQLRRRLWYGNTEAITSIESGEASRRRIAARGIKCVLAGATRPVRQVLARQAPQLRFALAEVLRGIGRVLGAAGVWLRHH